MWLTAKVSEEVINKMQLLLSSCKYSMSDTRNCIGDDIKGFMLKIIFKNENTGCSHMLVLKDNLFYFNFI